MQNLARYSAMLIFKPQIVRRKDSDMYQMNEERQKELWSDCVFVFDTSALLALYLYPEEARQQIYKEIFEKIKDRLWIPQHVLYEFQKNRIAKIKEPIVRGYKPLDEQFIQPMIAAFDRSLKQVDTLKNTIRNADSHPYMVAEGIEQYEHKLRDFVKATVEFGNAFNKQMEQKIAEILQLEQHDTVLENIERYFKVGREYSYEEILKITIEGKHRYEFKIPPGYEDLKDKVGTQIFGDLIIWKQMMEFARENKKSIVFICNDMKEDWWQLQSEKKNEKKRTLGPRGELIKEMRDHSGSDFWMYNQARFFDLANTLIRANVLNRYIDQASRLLVTRALDKYLVYICDQCNQQNSIDTAELRLDFEVSASDGSLRDKIENRYLAETEFECRYCRHKITASFEVWEYPLGIIHHHQTFLKGAALIRENPVEEERLLEHYDPASEVEEIFIIDRKQLRLKGGKDRKVTFAKAVHGNHTLFRMEYIGPLQHTKKRIQIEAYENRGDKISKTLVLDNGPTQFVMRSEKENSDPCFSYIELSTETDMTIALSVTEYPGTDRYLEKLFY